MYGDFQACPQLYSAQAPINSVYKHIHFFISRGLGVSAHSQGGLCAARLNIIISKIVTLKRYIKSKNNIARLR